MAASGCLWLSKGAPRNLMHKTTPKVQRQQPRLKGTVVVVLHRLAARHHAQLCSRLSFMLQSNQLCVPSLPHETSGLMREHVRRMKERRRAGRVGMGKVGIRGKIRGYTSQEGHKPRMTEIERLDTGVWWRGYREAEREREDAKSDHSKSRRIQKQLNNYSPLFCSFKLFWTKVHKLNLRYQSKDIKRSTIKLIELHSMYINLKWDGTTYNYINWQNLK